MPGSSSIEKILRTRTLRRAFAKVRANGGTAGGDGFQAEDLAAYLDTEISCLRAQIRSGTYRPGPLRTVAIPKNAGGTRLLRIPPVIDRMLQTATNMTLMPVFDRSMHRGSYGYRPRRSVPMALRDLRRCRGWVIDADIETFFDSVAHEPLRREVRRHLKCRDTFKLIDLWLRSFGSRGLATGSPISPLLANIALGPLDNALGKHGRLIRYADDFVVVCADRPAAETARRDAARVLRAAGLRLHPDKTRIVPPGAPFKFLGERIDLTDRRFQRGGLWDKPQKTNELILTLRGRSVRVGGLVGLIWEGWRKALNLTLKS